MSKKKLVSEPQATFIAIKAPYGATVEIPNPEELGTYFKDLGYPEDSVMKYQVNVKSCSSGSADSRKGIQPPTNPEKPSDSTVP